MQSNATQCLHYYNIDESSLVALEEWLTDQPSQNLLTWELYSSPFAILLLYCVKMNRVCHYNSLSNRINVLNIYIQVCSPYMNRQCFVTC